MVYNPFHLRSGISQSVPFSIIELGVVPKCFVKAACEVFGIIESYFVCFISDIFILCVSRLRIISFPRKQPVVTHELSGRLSRQILHFFVHQTFAYPHCFDEIAYFVIRVLIVFFTICIALYPGTSCHWILFRYSVHPRPYCMRTFVGNVCGFPVYWISGHDEVSSNGFKRYSSTPIRKLSMRDSLDVLAVSIRKGICEMAKLDFTRRDSSIPSMTGIIKSLTMKSTFWDWSTVNASSPSGCFEHVIIFGQNGTDIVAHIFVVFYYQNRQFSIGGRCDPVESRPVL